MFVHEQFECSYKREMRKKFPDVEKAHTYNARFAVGVLIEEALKARFRDVEEHRYEKEVEIDGVRYVVSGIVDIVDPETKVPIEVKYQTSFTGVPREHHLLQLRLYLWVTNIGKGELLYVGPEGLKAFEVKSPPIDDEVISLIRDVKIPRWIEWECGYCLYEAFCSKSVLRRR